MAGRMRAQKVTVTAVMCLAVFVTSGCGLRWETEPSPVPVADQATLERDALAAAVDAVKISAATRSSGAGLRATDIATAQLEVLGGVYVAYPDAEVEPTASPSPPLGLDDAIAALRLAAREIAATTADANLASIATSIDLAWAVSIAWDGRVSAPEGDVASVTTAMPLPLPDGTASTAGFVPVLDTAIPDDVIADLAVQHDHARFAYETAAAHLFAHERDAALERARAHGERADALQSSTTAEDRRTTLYQLRDIDLGDAMARESFLLDIETDFAARYAALAVTATGADRDWLLNAAFAAYVTAFESGAGEELVSPLPGLSVPAR